MTMVQDWRTVIRRDFRKASNYFVGYIYDGGTMETYLGFIKSPKDMIDKWTKFCEKNELKAYSMTYCAEI